MFPPKLRENIQSTLSHEIDPGSRVKIFGRALEVSLYSHYNLTYITKRNDSPRCIKGTIVCSTFKQLVIRDNRYQSK